MPFKPADPRLEQEYEELFALIERGEIEPEAKNRASNLALKLRSRLIDLAVWQMDYSKEATELTRRCKFLTQHAAGAAHPLLQKEFGISE